MEYRVVVNRCFGGFSLSEEAVELARKRGLMIDDHGWFDLDSYVARHNKVLVGVVDELGSERASGSCSRLEVYELSSPLYRIEEYDGREIVHEPGASYWDDARRKEGE
tara:strand:- start:936 stop:1259 length:324 start_codon:yes stop_codon:yes gene_type:complete